MIEKYLNKLEYNKILDLVSNYCSTYIGKDFVSKLMPLNNKDLVKMKLEETSTAQTLLYRKGEPPISNITNIDIWIKNLESYNSLSAKALLDVAHVLQTSRFLHDYFFADDTFDLSDFSLLEDYFSMLYYNETIEKNILNSIIDEYTIADDASKALSALRRNKRKLEQDVRDKLSNFIHSSSYSKYLMDSIITIRNDRFVIPVKEEYKDSISGAILDISASGSTVYIEPSSIFELNNKINGFKLAEKIRDIDSLGYIIFITTHSELTYLTFKYRVEAMDFILKDNVNEIDFRINECLSHIHKHINKEKSDVKTLTLTLDDRIIKILLKDIVFIETSTNSHKIIIHESNRKTEIFTTLKEISKNLDDRFYRCHRAYIVNKNRIKEINKINRIVYMDNGAECLASFRLIKGLYE